MRKFFVVSFAIHCIALFIVYRMPLPQPKATSKSLITTLVSPEVLRPPVTTPAPILPPPRMRPRPVPQPSAPLRRPPAPTPIIPPERPLIPSEGSGGGKTLPETIHPKSGRGGDAGSGEAGRSKSPDGTGTEQRGPVGRRELFDRGIAESIARKGARGQGIGRGTRDDAVTLDTSEYRFTGYNKLLKGKIESIWVYPPEALARRIYGDLRIKFTILKDGRLGPVELVRTSGYKMLDEAAIKALKDGEPYWPLPDEWGMDSYTIVGHFVYSLYRGASVW